VKAEKEEGEKRKETWDTQAQGRGKRKVRE
jgi:hypothetical protein